LFRGFEEQLSNIDIVKYGGYTPYDLPIEEGRLFVLYIEISQTMTTLIAFLVLFEKLEVNSGAPRQFCNV
jgi:hypothetical protein